MCLLKGATDRPESRAIPAGRLLTALTARQGVARCQQLPLPIKQQPECQRESEWVGEVGLRGWGGGGGHEGEAAAAGFRQPGRVVNMEIWSNLERFSIRSTQRT